MGDGEDLVDPFPVIIIKRLVKELQKVLIADVGVGVFLDLPEVHPDHRPLEEI